MKRILFSIAILLFAITPLQAQQTKKVFVTRDANGVLVFSDSPQPDAEEVDLSSRANVMAATDPRRVQNFRWHNTGLTNQAITQDGPKLIGLLAKVAGTLFIRRGSGDSAHVSAQMAEAIGEGKRVLFFPEGTTTDGHTVKRFFAKLFQTAHLAGCRIQPMVLCYQHEGELHPLAPFIGDDEMGAHLLNLLALGPMDVTVQFLPVIDPAGHTAPELVIHCEDIMRTALHALHGASPAPLREGWPGVVVRKAAS